VCMPVCACVYVCVCVCVCACQCATNTRPGTLWLMTWWLMVVRDGVARGEQFSVAGLQFKASICVHVCVRVYV